MGPYWTGKNQSQISSNWHVFSHDHQLPMLESFWRKKTRPFKTRPFSYTIATHTHTYSLTHRILLIPRCRETDIIEKIATRCGSTVFLISDLIKFRSILSLVFLPETPHSEGLHNFLHSDTIDSLLAFGRGHADLLLQHLTLYLFCLIFCDKLLDTTFSGMIPLFHYHHSTTAGGCECSSYRCIQIGAPHTLR